jgi:hypothetical protein
VTGAQTRTLARRVLTLAVVLAGVGAIAPAAGAYEPRGDVAVADFATGFASERGIGPVGVAFDEAGDLYVAAGQHLHRFGPAGGQAGLGSQVNPVPISGHLTGLTFGKDGLLYAARKTGTRTGDVIQLDAETGLVRRTVASGLPCPTGIATDPLSGDLLVSEVDCGSRVVRVSNVSGGAASVTTYFSGVVVDGLTFGPDGTLYAATAPDATGATVSRVDGTNSATPGRRTALATVPGADGVALAAPRNRGAAPPFLIVNRTDGAITRVGLESSGSSDLVTGGSRGDFIAVGPDRCLYATQSDSVIKVTNRDGSCARGPGDEPALGDHGLLPTTTRPSPPAGAFVKGVTATRRCTRTRRVTLRLRAPRGVRLRSARIYRGGKLVKRLGARGVRRRVVLHRQPSKAFTLTVRATTRSGRRIVLRKRISACRPARR